MLYFSMAIKRSLIIEKIRAPYYVIRNNSFIYINFINRKHRVTPSDPIHLDLVQEKILQDLSLNGIAIAAFDELFPKEEFSKLLNWVNKNELNLKQKSKKKFLYSYYGTDDISKSIDLENPFVQFYLSEKLLQIAISYLGYIPELYEIYIEKTVPVGDASPEYSQNWHRDPEEKKTLKIFLYLNDVDNDCGPFTYILGSQPTGKSKLSKLFPQKLPHGSYPEADSVKNSVEDKSYFIATAKMGTLIFCDTAGLHRGGHATKHHRIMSTAFFPSKRYSLKPLYNLESLRDSDPERFNLNSLALKVLGLK